MDIRGKRFVVIGGAGLIGSHTVDTLLRHDIGEIVVYDNFVRGTDTNLEDALRDDRVKVFEAGGDILQTDVLADALRGRRRRVPLRGAVAAALSRVPACRVRRERSRQLQCVRGVCRGQRRAPRLLVLGVGLRRRGRGADDGGSPVQQHELLRGDEDRR